MGRGIHWLGSAGGRGLLDWVWLAAGFTLLLGLVLRVSGSYFGSHVRFIGIAATCWQTASISGEREAMYSNRLWIAASR